MRRIIIEIAMIVVLALALFFMVMGMLMTAGCDSRTVQVEMDDGKLAYYSSTTVLRDNQLANVKYDPATGAFEVTGFNSRTSPILLRIFEMGYELGMAGQP